MSQNAKQELCSINALITVGLGFIGAPLARRLVDLGAQVTLEDSLIPEYGGNLFNFAGSARPAWWACLV